MSNTNYEDTVAAAGRTQVHRGLGNEMPAEAGERLDTYASLAAWVHANVGVENNDDSGTIEHEEGLIEWGENPDDDGYRLEMNDRRWRAWVTYTKDKYGNIKYDGFIRLDYEGYLDDESETLGDEWKIAKPDEGEAHVDVEGTAASMSSLILQTWLRGMEVQHDVLGFWR